MSYAFSPQLINEIWTDYKYPKGEGKELSQTGYDKFHDYDFNEKSYDFNENIQGQASLGNNKPKILQEYNYNDYTANNVANGNKNVFEGFRPNPMDHPSTTKLNIDMYNNKSYNYQNGPNNFRYSDEECSRHLEHILQCRYCYDHLRKKLGLDNNTNHTNNMNNGGFLNTGNLLNTGNVNNLLNVALVVMSGVFLIFMIDTLISRRK